MPSSAKTTRAKSSLGNGKGHSRSASHSNATASNRPQVLHSTIFLSITHYATLHLVWLPKGYLWHSGHLIDRDIPMHVESFIGNLGLWLGTVVRWIVESLSGLFTMITQAGSNFIDGMARALGMDTSIVSIAVLVLGLLFLYNAVRAFMRASIIGGVIWLLLGLWVLSWIIN